MLHKLRIASILTAFVFSLPVSAASISANYAVPGSSGPWAYVASGINSSYPYGESGGRGAPVVVDSSNGFVFATGNTINVTYLNGTVKGNNGDFPFTDANGDTSKVRNSTDSTNGDIYPAYYMSSTQYPVYQCELIGVFTDGSGSLVGTPLKIGNAATLTIPAGASKLNLGLNDDYFGDNSGTYFVQVTQNVPEPTAIGAISGLVFLSLKRHPKSSSAA